MPFRILTIALVLLTPVCRAQPPRYRVVPLQPLGINQSTFGGGTVAINRNGIVAGASDDGHEFFRATIWRRGHPVELQTPTGMFSWAQGINASCRVVGCVQSAVGAPTQAVEWVNNQMRPLPTTLPVSLACAINDSGTIVGWESSHEPYHSHALIWSQHGVHRLPGIGPDDLTGAYTVNQRGQVGGSGATPDGRAYPIIWENGLPQRLDVPGEPIECYVLHLNDRGQAVGHYVPGYTLDSSVIRWTHGTPEFLPQLFPQAPHCLQQASGLNNSGDVVGYSYSDGQFEGFLFQDGRLYKLSDLIEPGSGYRVWGPGAINDGGLITVRADLGNQNFDALMIPVR